MAIDYRKATHSAYPEILILDSGRSAVVRVYTYEGGALLEESAVIGSDDRDARALAVERAAAMMQQYRRAP